MHGSAVALVEAAAFTLGCIAIHALRRHALRLTTILLAVLAIVVFLGIAANAMIHPEAEADEYDMLAAWERAL